MWNVQFFSLFSRNNLFSKILRAFNFVYVRYVHEKLTYTYKRHFLNFYWQIGIIGIVRGGNDYGESCPKFFHFPLFTQIFKEYAPPQYELFLDFTLKRKVPIYFSLFAFYLRIFPSFSSNIGIVSITFISRFTRIVEVVVNVALTS